MCGFAGNIAQVPSFMCLEAPAQLPIMFRAFPLSAGAETIVGELALADCAIVGSVWEFRLRPCKVPHSCRGDAQSLINLALHDLQSCFCSPVVVA